MTKTEQNLVVAARPKLLREASVTPRSVVRTCHRPLARDGHPGFPSILGLKRMGTYTQRKIPKAPAQSVAAESTMAP